MRPLAGTEGRNLRRSDREIALFFFARDSFESRSFETVPSLAVSFRPLRSQFPPVARARREQTLGRSVRTWARSPFHQLGLLPSEGPRRKIVNTLGRELRGGDQTSPPRTGPYDEGLLRGGV